MRIHGIGIDVVEVERIGSSMAEFGERLFNAGDGAEREGAKRSVARIVAECHGFAMQACVLDGDGGGGNTGYRDLASG